MRTIHAHKVFKQLLLLVVFLPFQLDAQLNLSKLEGLPGNQCYSIIQDSVGYIWISTDKGLAQYNGKDIRVYSSQENHKHWQGSDNIRYMAAGAYPNLWICTEDDIKLFDLKKKECHIIAQGETRYIVEDSIGHVWWITKGQLYHLTPEQISNRTFKFDTLFSDIKLNHYLYPNTKRQEIYAYSSDKKTLYNLNLGSKTVTSCPSKINYKRTTPAWVQYLPLITDDHQVRYYDAASNEMKLFLDLDKESAVTPTMTDHIQPHSNGKYYILTKKGDLLLASEGTLHKSWKFQSFFKEQKADRVSSFLIDRNKHLWFTTFNGVYHQNFGNQEFKKIGTSEKPFDKSCRKIIAQDNENIFVGTYGGLYQWNKKDNRHKKISGGNVYEITPHNAGWFLGYDKDPLAYFKNGNVQQIDEEEENIFSLVTLDKNRLLYGGFGLWSRENKTKKQLFKEKLGKQRIEYIYQAKAHQYVYYICGSKGLYVSNSDFTSLENLVSEPKFRNLHYYYANNIGTDSLLCATSNGLLLVTPKGKILKHWSLADGLNSNEVYGFLQHKKNIWFSTANGLHELNLENQSIRLFKNNLIFNSNEFNRASFYKDQEGTMYFGSTRGVLYFHPNSIGKPSFKEKVIIEEINFTNRKGEKRKATSKNLLPDDRFMEVRFMLPYFSNAEQTEFAYKIEDIHENYVSLGNEQKVQFAGLPFGKHKLLIRARANGASWSEPTITHFVVEKPIHLRWWFITLCILGLGSIIFYIVQQRIQQLKQKKQEQLEQSRRIQTELEKERAKITSYLHDSLGQNLAVLKMKSDTKQAEEISELIEEVRDVSKRLYPQNLEKQGLAVAVENLCESLSKRTGILISSDIEDFDIELDKENKLVLYRFIQEGLNNIIKHSEARYATVRYIREERLLEIIDNGKGLPESIPTHGLGLQYMQDKARLLEAEIAFINNKPGLLIRLQF